MVEIDSLINPDDRIVFDECREDNHEQCPIKTATIRHRRVKGHPKEKVIKTIYCECPCHCL